MFKKYVSLFLCVCMIITMCLTLCSCKNEKSDEYPVTIGDVTIEEEPLNIVVLSDCLADIISYMGYDVKMVGRSVECDQEFLSIVPTVGSQNDPDIEAIISYQTNLVIAQSPLTEGAETALTQADIPVLVLNRAESFSKLKTLYSQLGAALGGNVTGKATGEDSYNELVTTIKDFENAIPSNIVKTACYLYLDESGALCTLTKGTIEYQLFSHCNAINVFSEQEKPQVDLEQLKISTPAYIFYDDEKVIDFLKSNSELSTLGALSNNQTLQIKMSDFNRQGTTYENLVYEMISFMFGKKATPDEATPDDAQTVEETAAAYVSE